MQSRALTGVWPEGCGELSTVWELFPEVWYQLLSPGKSRPMCSVTFILELGLARFRRNAWSWQ